MHNELTHISLFNLIVLNSDSHHDFSKYDAKDGVKL
jgi:hypothetical protein